MADRIQGTMNSIEAMFALTGNNRSAIVALGKISPVMGSAFESLLVALDTKRLYDDRINELFELCGRDPERFIYHVLVELPNQDTGVWNMSGPYAAKYRKNSEFKDARRFGKPGSFWALESPPSSRDYKYPIL